MQLPSRTPSQEFEFELDDPIPDSSVRPTAPPPGVGRVREAVTPAGARMLSMVIRATSALLGPSRSGYVTLSVPDGEVLFEGELDTGGKVELCVMVSADVESVEATLEAGTKYRKAKVALEGNGITDYTFA